MVILIFLYLYLGLNSYKEIFWTKKRNYYHIAYLYISEERIVGSRMWKQKSRKRKKEKEISLEGSRKLKMKRSKTGRFKETDKIIGSEG